MKKIRVFDYVPELDCFVVAPEFEKLSNRLGLTEWHPAVWIGRLFTMDNDFGEHWFDHWEARERLESRATALGLEMDQLMIIDPDRFQDGKDGPCHSAEFRYRFWRDVLQSLTLSLDLLFDEAREFNRQVQEILPEEYIPDLEVRIEQALAEAEGGR